MPEPAGRHDEAVRSRREAVATALRLVAVDPRAFVEDLPIGVFALTQVLVNADRPMEVVLPPLHAQVVARRAGAQTRRCADAAARNLAVPYRAAPEETAEEVVRLTGAEPPGPLEDAAPFVEWAVRAAAGPGTG